MYPQGQGYPQQPGGYGYPPPPQQGYPGAGGYPSAGGYPPSGGYQQPYGAGPQVNLNFGPQAGFMAGGGDGGFGFGAEPTGLFAEKAIRQAFISKVYSMLTLQLIFTSILIGMFVLNEDTKRYFAHSQGWMFLGFAIFMVSYLVLVCVESARRSSPINLILLFVLTFGYGLVAAVTSCRYDTKVVFFAFVATGVSCFLIAAFAKSTKFDMTNCGTTLCLIGLAHMLIGMIMVLILVPMGYARTASLLLSISGALLASLYLIFDLQLIMGGRKCELSPEEYILACVMLYTDIIQIFIYLLEIFSRMSND
jgi:FtsH-binding integral membrane protein